MKTQIVHLYTIKSQRVSVELTGNAVRQLRRAMQKAFYDPRTGMFRPAPECRIQAFAENGVCLLDEAACNLKPIFSVSPKTR